jgi:hypothetical protein
MFKNSLILSNDYGFKASCHADKSPTITAKPNNMLIKEKSGILGDYPGLFCPI